MYSIIANKNILIKKSETIDELKAYIKGQKMYGDECRFENEYFSCFEIIPDNEVNWTNIISFEEYKAIPKKKFNPYEDSELDTGTLYDIFFGIK